MAGGNVRSGSELGHRLSAMNRTSGGLPKPGTPNDCGGWIADLPAADAVPANLTADKPRSSIRSWWIRPAACALVGGFGERIAAFLSLLCSRTNGSATQATDTPHFVQAKEPRHARFSRRKV